MIFNWAVSSKKVDYLYPRKVMEVAEKCRRKGWNCPHLENRDSCYHMEEMDHEHIDL